MSLQNMASTDHVISSAYRPIGGETDERPNRLNILAAFAGFSAVIGIFLFFLITAIHDAKDPPADMDMNAFKRDFAVFLETLSYQPDNSTLLENATYLNTTYPNYFLSYLSLAMAYQAVNQTEAQYWLQQAKDAGSDDTYKLLLPTDQEWADQSPTQTLIQLSNDTWVVPYFYSVAPWQPFSVFECGYLIRLKNNSLVFLNPVPVLSQVQDQIKAIRADGPDFLIEQSKTRYAFLTPVSETYPNASIYGVTAQKDYGPTMNINFTGFLSDDAPLFPNDFNQSYILGQDGDECALLHLSTSTLFLSDLVIFNAVTRAQVPGTLTNETSFLMRLHDWAYGSYDNLWVPSGSPEWGNITDASLFSTSLTTIQNYGFTNLFLCQGGIILSGADDQFKTAIAPYIVKSS